MEQLSVELKFATKMRNFTFTNCFFARFFKKIRQMSYQKTMQDFFKNELILLFFQFIYKKSFKIN
jgi:hypothetical protein